MKELSCKWQDNELFPFPLILSNNNVSTSLLFSSPLLFTLRPILSTLTVGVFCYQCFEHSSRQRICRNSRLSAGSRGEYIDKRWGDATHKHAYSDISLLYLISNMIFYSTLSHFILLYSILSNPFLFCSTVLRSILFHSTLSYSILLYPNLFYHIIFNPIPFYHILSYRILFYSMIYYHTVFYSILFYHITFYSILFSSFSLYKGNIC